MEIIRKHVVQKLEALEGRTLIAFAKSDQCSKAELSKYIEDEAARLRQRGESQAVAYSKYITEGEIGCELFHHMQLCPGYGHRQLEALAFAKRGVRSRSRSMSPRLAH